MPIKLSGCDRCGGALVRTADETYCLMCGHRPQSLQVSETGSGLRSKLHKPKHRSYRKTG